MALLNKVGSLPIQTRAGEVVALVDVKNCGESETDDVKKCRGRHSATLLELWHE